MLYVHGRDKHLGYIHWCDCQSLIESCRELAALKWNEKRITHVPTDFLTFRQHLIMVCEDSIYAYHPLTDEWLWVLLGRIPVRKILGESGKVASSTVLSTGDLLAICDLGFPFRVSFEFMRMSLISKY